MAALRNLSLKIPGIIGGLLAILIGLAWLVFGFMASTSAHVGSAAELTMTGAVVLIIFGLLAICSSAFYAKMPGLASKLLLSSGIMGFFVAYAADYPIAQGLFGLITWTVPGALIIVAGLIGLVTPERLASLLPILKSDRVEVRLAAHVLYGGALVMAIAVMMAVLLTTGILLLGFQEESKSDDALLSEAMMHESYGAYDSALSVYDRILARNQSNAIAWRERGYALEKMGRRSEANSSYEKARLLAG